jgi:hypothetical protein
LFFQESWSSFAGASDVENKVGRVLRLGEQEAIECFPYYTSRALMGCIKIGIVSFEYKKMIMRWYYEDETNHLCSSLTSAAPMPPPSSRHEEVHVGMVSQRYSLSSPGYHQLVRCWSMVGHQGICSRPQSQLELKMRWGLELRWALQVILKTGHLL